MGMVVLGLKRIYVNDASRPPVTLSARRILCGAKLKTEGMLHSPD
jgi:hypothetical protein